MKHKHRWWKRALMLLPALCLACPASAGAMPPPYVPPKANESAPVALPFPLTDASVAVTDAVLRFEWGDYDYRRSMGCTYSAEFTMEYTGGEPGVVPVAIPVLYADDYTVLVDGKPADSRVHFTLAELSYEEPLTAEGWDELSFSDNFETIRAQSEPYVPLHFDADAAESRVYKITVDGPMRNTIGIFLSFSYDPYKTKLLISAPFDMIPDGHGRVRKVFFDRPQAFEVLVIGEDSLTWSIHSQHDPDDSKGYSLQISEPLYEAPRQFLVRIQEECDDFSSIFPHPVKADDMLMRWADHIMSILPYSYANVRCLGHMGYNNFNGCLFERNDYRSSRPSYLYDQQTVVTAIPFQPGERRTLSILYTSDAGMLYSEMRDECLFYSPILTESAGYWDSFAPLTIHTGLEEGVITAVPGEGNLFLSQWQPAIDPPAGSGGLFVIYFLVVAGVAALSFFIIFVQIIVAIAAAITMLCIWLAKRNKRWR